MTTVFAAAAASAPKPDAQGSAVAATDLGYAAGVRDRLDGARIWHVNSTATGGGVAELLRRGIPAHADLGLPAGWLVSDAPAAFFELTKRLHHGLHGRRAGEPISAADVAQYHTVTGWQATELLQHVRPGDLVVLHDPQTLGTAPRLIAAGVKVAWRSHIGTTRHNAETAAVWGLLLPYLEQVPHCVFTATAYAPAVLPAERIHVILPSIDPLSPKNREIGETLSAELLASVGLTAAGSTDGGSVHQVRGEPGGSGPTPVGRTMLPLGRTMQDAPLPAGAPVLLQVSRWDPLKDMTGVLHAFGAHLADRTDAHLVLAGPDPADIPDDPEGQVVYGEVVRAREELRAAVRARVHLVMLSLRDAELNALAVNALQRRATVVSQKSLEEGFGLTVAEAMWKRRPVVASRVGGLTVQLGSDQAGVLIDDPSDLRRFADAVCGLLHDPGYAARIGEAAHQRCARRFLAARELGDYLRLYLAMLTG